MNKRRRYKAKAKRAQRVAYLQGLSEAREFHRRVHARLVQTVGAAPDAGPTDTWYLP